MFTVGFVMAFIVALIAVKTFLQLIKRISFPFAIYRFIVAAACTWSFLGHRPQPCGWGQRCSLPLPRNLAPRQLSRISAPLKPAATTSLVETDCATSRGSRRPLRIISWPQKPVPADVGFAGEGDRARALRFTPRVNAVEKKSDEVFGCRIGGVWIRSSVLRHQFRGSRISFGTADVRRAAPPA